MTVYTIYTTEIQKYLSTLYEIIESVLQNFLIKNLKFIATEICLAPQLIEPLTDPEVVEGGMAQFQCRVFSSSPSTYVWRHNEKQLLPSEKYRMSSDGDVYILNVTTVDVQDRGFYKCTISNQDGDVTCIARLVVER